MKINQPRRTLIITALIFFTPILIAVTLHQFPGLVGFTGTKNHGNLIQPARPLDKIRLLENGNILDKKAFEGRWTYVVFSKQSCDEACSKRLYKTRQVRHALGKDIERAQRMLILLDDGGTPVTEMLDAHQDMRMTKATNSDEWLMSFELPEDPETAIKPNPIEQIYLVDPLGNLMMYYPVDIDGPRILKDIQRLVKVSWIKPK